MESAKRLIKTGSLLIVVFLSALGAIGQDISVAASVNKNPVSPGEAFYLTITINNSDGQVNMPNIAGLQYLYGPSKGQNVSIINGNRSLEITYSYTFKAPKEGEFEIPEISVRTSKGVMKTQPFKLRVKRNDDPAINQNFMTRIEPTSRNVFLGEPVILEYKVYQRYNSFNIESYELPEFDGFWVETVESHQGRWESQVINGQRYNVATIKIDVIFPQQTGEFTLDGFEMTGAVGGFFNRQRVVASSSPTKITVNPLPPGKPDGFIGSFQSLSLEVEHSSEALRSNEAFNLELRFSGKGNMRLIGEPSIDWPSDLEVFEPEVSDRITTAASGVSGKRSFSYVIIPRSAGTYTIPGQTLSYFDTRKKTYQTLSIAPIVLNVAKGNASADVPYSFNSKSDVQVLNKDIRFIRSDIGKLSRPSNIFFGSTLFYLGFGAPFVLFGVAIVYRRKLNAEAADVAGTRRKKAKGIARKYLKEAAGKEDDRDAFYLALSKGLEGYVLDRFNMQRSSFNRRELEQKLKDVTNAELAAEYFDLWNQCEQARFAPGAAAAPAELLNRAERIIDKLESAS